MFFHFNEKDHWILQRANPIYAIVLPEILTRPINMYEYSPRHLLSFCKKANKQKNYYRAFIKQFKIVIQLKLHTACATHIHTQIHKYTCGSLMDLNGLFLNWRKIHVYDIHADNFHNKLTTWKWKLWISDFESFVCFFFQLRLLAKPKPYLFNKDSKTYTCSYYDKAGLL